MTRFADCEIVDKNCSLLEHDTTKSNIGPNLTTKSTELINLLNNKIIGLYFSAGWCPPCRNFTPILRDFYEAALNKDKIFEIVFISFDKTAEDMEAYYREMHGDWLAVKFGDAGIEKLKSAYNVECVPKLIITNSSGSVISERGRKEIQDRGLTCMRSWRSSPLMHHSLPTH